MITTPNNFRDNYVVVIDSLDRDLAKYPNPSNYVIALPETLRNVETIELMSFQLTRTETNVNSGNNTFKIIEKHYSNVPNPVLLSTTPYTITIPVKEYASGVELVNELNTVLSPNAYTATFDAETDKITISRLGINGPVIIKFEIQIEESAAKLFGISGTGTRGSGIIPSVSVGDVTSITSNKTIDLAGIPYLIVYLNDYERIVAPGSKSHKNFLVVPMENHPVGKRFIISGDQKEKKGIYILTNNQKNMYEMRVSIRRPDGTLYDFNGTDHLLIFRIYRHDYRDFNS